MATTTNSDMVIYNQLAQTGFLEKMQDNLGVFNQNSGGAIILDSEMIEGDLKASTAYRVGGELIDRNVNSSTPPTPKKISSFEEVGIKKPWGYGPYASTEEQFKRRARTPAEFYTLMGQDAGEAWLAGAITVAASSLEAAIGTNTNMNVTVDWATHNKKVLTAGMRKFGDKFGRIGLFSMNSETYFDMVDSAIDEKVFNEAGVVIYGGTPGTMNVPVLISDKFTTGKILGLQGGAARVTESQATEFRAWEHNDSENFEMRFKGEGTFNSELLGYRWKDKTAVNPTFAQLATGSKWEKSASSDKSTAGVIINVTAAPTGGAD